MSGIMNMLVAAKTTIAAATDEFFNRVALLLNTSSTNGAQNNTFLDSSSNNFTITRNGNATQGTFTPFSQTGWSNYFDGTDDYLAIADNSVLRAGASNFTLEAWIWRNASGSAHTIYAKGGASTGIVFQVTSTNVLRFTHTTTNIDSTGTIAANSWTHVAVVREGTGTNQTKLYINGTQDGQGTVSTDFTQTEEVRIGTDRSAASDFNGYISNLRFVKGTALYTTTFTPSTTPLTTTSQGATATEVELLTCQNNRFLDNSSNAFALTVTGTPSIQAFSPFAPTASYDTTTVGGGGYFDGTGDYLTAPDNAVFEFGTGDFVLEGWFYPTTSGTVRVLAAHFSGSSGWSMELTTGDLLTFWSGNGTTTGYKVTSTAKVITNQWNYCAISRSGTSLNTFVNGVSGTAVTDSTNIADNAAVVAVSATPTGTVLFTGYSCDFRVRKGSAITSSTVPTAPLTNITNTSLLLNFTNAGIYDAAAKNDLETVGNAQVSTTQAKFGTTAMYFDGAGDYLTLPLSGPDFGSGDFTIDFWFYKLSTGGQRLVSARSNNDGITFGVNSSNLLTAFYGDTTVTGTIAGTTTIAINTWYYAALVRASGTTRIYLNGSVEGTPTSWAAKSFTSTAYRIGSSLDSRNEHFNGYMDDVRFTKYARTITTPTEAFPVQ